MTHRQELPNRSVDVPAIHHGPQPFYLLFPLLAHAFTPKRRRPGGPPVSGEQFAHRRPIATACSRDKFQICPFLHAISMCSRHDGLFTPALNFVGHRFAKKSTLL